MKLVVLLIGGLILAAGLVGMAKPDAFVTFARRFLRLPGALWLAAALRIAIGVVFLLAAPDTRWPVFVQVFGWIAIVVGVITPFFGSRLEVMLDWWTSRPPGFIRAWCVPVLALGGAIVFAGI